MRIKLLIWANVNISASFNLIRNSESPPSGFNGKALKDERAGRAEDVAKGEAECKTLEVVICGVNLV